MVMCKVAFSQMLNAYKKRVSEYQILRISQRRKGELEPGGQNKHAARNTQIRQKRKKRGKRHACYCMISELKEFKSNRDGFINSFLKKGLV